MTENFPILSLQIVLPLAGAIWIFAFGRSQKAARTSALIFSVSALIVSILLMYEFVYGNTTVENGFKFAEYYSWIPSIGMHYFLGIDGISLPLVFLTTLLTTLSIIFSWDREFRPKEFFGLLLLMEVGILGVFTALDFFLFYVFWEIVLIPMYFLIGIWGGPNKHYAAIKFFIYTHIGSLAMLLGVLAIYFKAGPLDGGHYTFNMIELAGATSSFSTNFQYIVFLALLFGFGVKIPTVPVHTWLPDAHVEAPTAGSVILAGLLLKMGGYGLIRIGVGMLPQAAVHFYWLIAVLGVTCMIYGALVCLAQRDLKKLVAFSSISHMGFVLLGISTLSTIGMAGAVFQMFNHGLITAVLFMLCGVIKHHTHTRDIPDLRGLGTKMPVASGILIIGFFASLGLPGLNGFVSEFMVFLGGYNKFDYWVLIPLISVVVTGAYYLWTLQKILMGKFNEKLGEVTDATAYEIIPLAVLIALIIIIGIYPSPLVNMMWSPSETYTGLFSFLEGG